MPRPSYYREKWQRLRELAARNGGELTMTRVQLCSALGVSPRWLHNFLRSVSGFNSVSIVITRGRYANVTLAFAAVDTLPSKCRIESIRQKRQAVVIASNSVNSAKTKLENGAQFGIYSQVVETAQEVGVNAELNSIRHKPTSIRQKPLLTGPKTNSSAPKNNKCRIAKVLEFPTKSSPTRTRGRTHARPTDNTEIKNEQDEGKASLRSAAPSAQFSEKKDQPYQIATKAERGELPRQDIARFYRRRRSLPERWEALLDGVTRRLTAAFIAKKATVTRRPKHVVAEAEEKNGTAFRRAAELAIALYVEDERFTVERFLEVAWDTKPRRFASPLPTQMSSPLMAEKVREWLPPEARVEDDPNHRVISSLADMTPEERERSRQTARKNWYSYANMPMRDLPPPGCEDLEAFYIGEVRRLWREGLIDPTKDKAIPADVLARILEDR
jgi:hypothetical protein